MSLISITGGSLVSSRTIKSWCEESVSKGPLNFSIQKNTKYLLKKFNVFVISSNVESFGRTLILCGEDWDDGVYGL